MLELVAYFNYLGCNIIYDEGAHILKRLIDNQGYAGVTQQNLECCQWKLVE